MRKRVSTRWKCQSIEIRLTVTFDHKWLHNIVTDHLKVWMTNPVANIGFGTGEEVIEHGDLMTEKHQAVNQVRAYKASSASNQDTFALSIGEEFDGAETREGGIGDGVGARVEDGFRLVGCMASAEPCMLLLLYAICFFICIDSGNVVGTKIEGTKNIELDFRVKTETLETNGCNFVTILVEGADLEVGGSM